MNGIVNSEALKAKVGNVEAYSGFPPACACGCGEPTRFNSKGLQKYVDRQHQAWGKNYKQLSKIGNDAKRSDMIPIEDFRKAVNRLKENKGWTISYMSRKGGQQPGWLNTYMYDKRIKFIGLEAARTFFAKLAGQPAPATRYEQRTASRAVRKTDRAIADIGVDADKIKPNEQSFADFRKRQSRLRGAKG